MWEEKEHKETLKGRKRGRWARWGWIIKKSSKADTGQSAVELNCCQWVRLRFSSAREPWRCMQCNSQVREDGRHWSRRGATYYYNNSSVNQSGCQSKCQRAPTAPFFLSPAEPGGGCPDGRDSRDTGLRGEGGEGAEKAKEDEEEDEEDSEADRNERTGEWS